MGIIGPIKGELNFISQLGICYTKTELSNQLNIINSSSSLASSEYIVGYQVSILNHSSPGIRLEFKGISNLANYVESVVPDCTFLDIVPPYNSHPTITTPHAQPYLGNYEFLNYNRVGHPPFDFAYFGKDSLDILLTNSSHIVFSACMLNVTHSSYYGIGNDSESQFFSLKAEGDWQDSPPGSNPGATVPAIVYGPPCPPIWQNWMTLEIFQNNVELSKKNR